MCSWMAADPAISLLISFLIAGSVWPLLKDTGRVLVQHSHLSEGESDGLLRRIQGVDGVLALTDFHFWVLGSNNSNMCSIRVLVVQDQEEQAILRRVTARNGPGSYGCR